MRPAMKKIIKAFLFLPCCRFCVKRFSATVLNNIQCAREKARKENPLATLDAATGIQFLLMRRLCLSPEFR